MGRRYIASVGCARVGQVYDAIDERWRKRIEGRPALALLDLLGRLRGYRPGVGP
jgi:hypothetical protein